MKKIYTLLIAITISIAGIAQTCMTPTAVTVNNITASTADLNWTEINTPAANVWEIEYGLCGFVPTGVPTITTTTNPFTFTGLLPSTQYAVYLRSVCSATSSSPWTSVLCFTTNGPTATKDVQADEKNWFVYPNPSNGTFTIRISNPAMLKKISIVDISGKLIKTYATEQIAQGILINNLSSGVYFCKIVYEKNQSRVEKIVIR